MEICSIGLARFGELSSVINGAKGPVHFQSLIFYFMFFGWIRN